MHGTVAHADLLRQSLYRDHRECSKGGAGVTNDSQRFWLHEASSDFIS
jgi:hypothetical protein